MSIPYKAQLVQLVKQPLPVTVDRADAEPVTGDLIHVNDEGCFVRHEAPTDSVTFISYRDIRGVSAKSAWADSL